MALVQGFVPLTTGAVGEFNSEFVSQYVFFF
jgi:hypothetical protein